MSPAAVIIAGPTASGKSGLALALAQACDGVVINADSMQIYDGLRLLTARPSAEDEARCPHLLYGLLPPSEVCSAGRWQALATEACQTVWQSGRLPVVVGGTGLYLRALLDGLSPIPDIPDTIRTAARSLFADLGNEVFHARLAERDPVMAERLHPGNSQRLVRAWEVLEATGRSLADWQAEPGVNALPGRRFIIRLDPPRAQLYNACDNRFRMMAEHGALDEVKSLLSLNLDPSVPLMKALGVPELTGVLRGKMRLEPAIQAAQASTRAYAKRQGTWFRHQLSPDLTIDAQFSESLSDEIFPKIRRFLLTGAQ